MSNLTALKWTDYLTTEVTRVFTRKLFRARFSKYFTLVRSKQ